MVEVPTQSLHNPQKPKIFTVRQYKDSSSILARSRLCKEQTQLILHWVSGLR